MELTPEYGREIAGELFPGEEENFELYPELFPELEQELPMQRPSRATCPPKQTFVDCPAPKPPFEVLDHFVLNQSTLIPRLHEPKILHIVRAIVDSRKAGRPVTSVLIAGHADTSGSDDYNFALSRKRAESVLRRLCAALEKVAPGVTRGTKFLLTSCGKRQPKSKPEISRRVEVFLEPVPASQKPNPPDHSHCSVPRHKVNHEAELEQEFQELERAAASAALPRLSIFQNASNTSHRNHFVCQASRWARVIKAIASPNATACHKSVGPTSYDTGVEIVRAIEAAHTCIKQAVQLVHIFSHSGSNGVFGSASGGTVGLYMNGPDSNSRNQGGRSITDIPTAPLAQDVTFVLHGCNTAEGDDNFARALYQHLSSTLRNARVFGHFNSGCAGRDNSWREYSARSSNGERKHKTLAAIYQGNGCCS